MLTRLEIRDFAIIDNLTLDFVPGLNVFTGETGAGKSILLDALGATLGVRIGTEVVRAGAETARVEAAFVPANGSWAPALVSLLQEHGLEVDDSLILTREIRQGQGSVCRVNGRMTPLKVLAALGEMLGQVHTQGEQMSLLKPAYQLDLLDSYGGLLSSRQEIERRVHRLRQIRSSLNAGEMDPRELERRRDLLDYQIKEISAAKLQLGEDAELERKWKLLSNMERVVAMASQSISALSGEDAEVGSGAQDLLSQALHALRQLASLDSSVAPWVQQLEEVETTLAEIGRALISYRGALEFDQARLGQVEERMRLIDQLKKKYGSTIEEILSFGEKSSTALAEIEGWEEQVAQLRSEEARLLSELGPLCEDLSRRRAKAAKELASSVNDILAEAGMRHSGFSVTLDQIPEDDGVSVTGRTVRFDETGADRCEFLLAAGRGEPALPLRKIASTGELSRVMLALKSALSEGDEDRVLVLDEIDAGVGARTADLIGRRLATVARRHQILCVTHLPQLAAFADCHFMVTKEDRKGRTVARAEPLNRAGRVRELTAMVGTRNGHGREVAVDILEEAATFKQGKQLRLH